MEGESAELRSRVEAHLTERAGVVVRVQSVEPLAGGACQDNYKVAMTFESGPLAGARSMVLRSDSRTSLAGSLDRKDEYAVIGAAVERGVKTPAARFLGVGIVRAGAHAYFLDWVDGEAIGRRVVSSPKLEGARKLLGPELARELARIHGIKPAVHPDLLNASQARAPGFDPVGEALRFTRTILDRAEVSAPLELILRWLAENTPPREAGTRRETTLVHGDFRTGNFLVTPLGLAALLDWEFAHWGSPCYDLAWIALRDWRFGQLKLPIGGFARRLELYEAYERESGRTLSLQELHWWEVLGNLRWAAGSLSQARRYTVGGESDIELAAIGRRAAEMEYEALRLIDRGVRALGAGEGGGR